MDKIIPVLKDELVEDHFIKLLMCLGLSIDENGLLQEIEDPEKGSYIPVTTNDDKQLLFPLERYLSKINKLKNTIPFNPVTDKPHNSKTNVLKFVVGRSSYVFNYLLAVAGKLVLLFIEQQEKITVNKSSEKPVIDPYLLGISESFGPVISTLRKGSKLVRDYKKLIDKWTSVVIDDTDQDTGVKVLGILSKEIYGKTDSTSARAIMTLDSPLYAALKDNTRDDFEINGNKLSLKETKIFVRIFDLLFPCFTKPESDTEVIESDKGRYSVLSNSATNPIYECMLKLLIEVLPRLDGMLKALDDHLDAALRCDHYDFKKEKFSNKDLEILEELDSYVVKRVEHYAVNTNTEKKENDMYNTSDIYQKSNIEQPVQQQNPFISNQGVRQETEEERARKLLGLNNNNNGFGSHFVRGGQNVGNNSFFNRNNEYNPYGNQNTGFHYVSQRGNNMQAMNEIQQIEQTLINNGINPNERLVIYNQDNNGNFYEAIPTTPDNFGNWYDQYNMPILNSSNEAVNLWDMSQYLHKVKTQQRSFGNMGNRGFGGNQNNFNRGYQPTMNSQQSSNARFIPNGNINQSNQNNSNTFQFGGSNSSIRVNSQRVNPQPNVQQPQQTPQPVKITNVNQLPAWDQKTMIQSCLEFVKGEIEAIKKIIEDQLSKYTPESVLENGPEFVEEMKAKMYDLRDGYKARALDVMTHDQFIGLFSKWMTLYEVGKRVVGVKEKAANNGNAEVIKQLEEKVKELEHSNASSSYVNEKIDKIRAAEEDLARREEDYGKRMDELRSTHVKVGTLFSIVKSLTQLLSKDKTTDATNEEIDEINNSVDKLLEVLDNYEDNEDYNDTFELVKTKLEDKYNISLNITENEEEDHDPKEVKQIDTIPVRSGLGL